MLQGALAELRLGNWRTCATSGSVIDAEARRSRGPRRRDILPRAPASPPAVACRMRARHLRRPSIIETSVPQRTGPRAVRPHPARAELPRVRIGPARSTRSTPAATASPWGKVPTPHDRERRRARARRQPVVEPQHHRRGGGVQPFGGEGPVRHRPEGGGPLYLHRLFARTPGPVLADGAPAGDRQRRKNRAADAAFSGFLNGWTAPAAACSRATSFRRATRPRRRLPCAPYCWPAPGAAGPTGEDDSLRFTARGTIAGVADSAAAVPSGDGGARQRQSPVAADRAAARTVQAASPRRCAHTSRWMPPGSTRRSARCCSTAATPRPTRCRCGRRAQRLIP